MILKQRAQIGLYLKCQEVPDRDIFRMSDDSETEGPDRDIFKGCLMILKQRAQIGLYSGIDFNGN